MPFFVIRLLFLVPVSVITLLWFPLMHVMYKFVCFLVDTSPQFSLFCWNIVWKAHLMFSFDLWARKYEADKRYQSAAHNISPNIKKGIWCIEVFFPQCVGQQRTNDVKPCSGVFAQQRAETVSTCRNVRTETIHPEQDRRTLHEMCQICLKHDFSCTPYSLSLSSTAISLYYLN